MDSPPRSLARSVASPRTSPEGTPQVGEYVDGPRSQDVASTRHRQWHSHEQNVFYRELILKAAPNIDPNDNSSVKREAERIVDIIMTDKRGVFVKQVNSHSGWIVMSRKEAIVKAQSAIRNERIKAAANGHWPSSASRQRKKRVSFKKKPPAAARHAGPAKKPKKPAPKNIYRAQAGADTSIHPYALLLISAVCNHPNPQQALHVLDSPLSQCFSESEPPKERRMRLQVRMYLMVVFFLAGV